MNRRMSGPKLAAREKTPHQQSHDSTFFGLIVEKDEKLDAGDAPEAERALEGATN